jgi:hypothetical protein
MLGMYVWRGVMALVSWIRLLVQRCKQQRKPGFLSARLWIRQHATLLAASSQGAVTVARGLLVRTVLFC